eukprot:277431-Karenia_brevis.AAC.1
MANGNSKFEYSGLGFVQYRHPESLRDACNFQHCADKWDENSEEYGVVKIQRGFLMQQWVQDNM